MKEEFAPRPISRKEEELNSEALKSMILQDEGIKKIEAGTDQFYTFVTEWLKTNNHPDPDDRAYELFPKQ